MLIVWYCTMKQIAHLQLQPTAQSFLAHIYLYTKNIPAADRLWNHFSYAIWVRHVGQDIFIAVWARHIGQHDVTDMDNHLSHNQKFESRSCSSSHVWIICEPCKKKKVSTNHIIWSSNRDSECIHYLLFEVTKSSLHVWMVRGDC